MDLVERLRKEVNLGSGVVTPLREEAADYIERLLWENSNMEKLWGKSERTWMEIRDKQEATIEMLCDALDILQTAMVSKKPIPMNFKKAILNARAALKGGE